MGYQKISLNAGYNMIGAQFTKVGGAALDAAEDFIPGSNMSGVDTSTYQFTSYLMPWEGSGYGESIYWSGNTGMGADYDNKWLTPGWTPATCPISESEGTWIWTPSATTVLVSGEVVTTNVTVNLSAGYNMVCCPFPASMVLSAIVPAESMSGVDTSTYQFTSYIMPWDGSGYGESIYWSGNTGMGADYDNKWLTPSWTPASKTFLPGEGFWIYTPTACQVTFTSPISAGE